MLKVFRINDYDWYMANTIDEAIECAMRDTDLPRDEAADEPCELSDADLDRLVFVRDDETRVSFREELEERVKAGRGPGMFASTEY